MAGENLGWFSTGCDTKCTVTVKKMKQILKKACENFILVGVENSLMSMQGNKMCFENCDETEYDISKKIKKVSRNYYLHQVLHSYQGEIYG